MVESDRASQYAPEPMDHAPGASTAHIAPGHLSDLESGNNVAERSRMSPEKRVLHETDVGVREVLARSFSEPKKVRTQ